MKTDKLFLRYQFTEAEIKERSLELARATTQAIEAEESKKAAAAQFADLVLRSREKMSRLAREINNGYEMRDIECEIRLHKPSKGMAQIVRLDTGELVKERLMDHTELQEQLFSDDGEAKAAASRSM